MRRRILLQVPQKIHQELALHIGGDALLCSQAVFKPAAQLIVLHDHRKGNKRIARRAVAGAKSPRQNGHAVGLEQIKHKLSYQKLRTRFHQGYSA